MAMQMATTTAAARRVVHRDPLGIAFALRSAHAERIAGLMVVLAILISAFVAGYEAVDRLLNPRDVAHPGALAAAGALGFAGPWLAAHVRTRAGLRLDSAAPLIVWRSRS
jgi:Co/Zn/Cd efflux system component